MCRLQHFTIKDAIFDYAYDEVISNLLESLSSSNRNNSHLHLQLFLIMCSVPEGNSNSKLRRILYIPGETQDQRRLKRKAI